MALPKINFLKSDALVGLLICMLVCAGVVLVRKAGLLESTEFAAYDLYLRYQPRISYPEDRILLVSISESDIRRLGRWPINDWQLTQLIKSLLAHGPRVVGVDIFRNIEVPPGSDKLRELFSRDIPVVTVMKFGDKISPGVAGPYMVKDGSRTGFGDALIDTGGITRRALLFMDDGQESRSSFAFLLASSYLKKEGIVAQSDLIDPQMLKLGKSTFVPLETDSGGYINIDDKGYQFLLDFTSAKAGFKSISLSDAMAGNFADDAVRDKVVIIGAMAESLRDFFFMPISRSPEEGQRISGIELHAITVTQLLRSALNGEKPIEYFSERMESVWIFFWGLLGFGLGLRIHSFRQFALCLALFPALLAGLTFIYFGRGLWLAVTPPIFAFLLSADSVRLYLLSVEKRQRALLMRLFEKHVSTDIAKTIWAQREQFVKEGVPHPQQLIATVLFTDMQGFTTISEKLADAGKVMDWLNEYMEAMTTEVLNHGGVVDKYIGDALMAVFGVPVARVDQAEIARDAVNAIECAITMGRRLEDLNLKWEKEGRPTVKMRVGIYTGPLVVGCIGSKQRLEYTVIGDTVNIASRLEGVRREFETENTCRILIGESTFGYSGGLFEVRSLGSIQLKGKGGTVAAYQVLGSAKDNSEAIEIIAYEQPAAKAAL